VWVVPVFEGAARRRRGVDLGPMAGDAEVGDRPRGQRQANRLKDAASELLDGKTGSRRFSGTPRCSAACQYASNREGPAPEANAAGTITQLGAGTTKNAVNTSRVVSGAHIAASPGVAVTAVRPPRPCR